LTIDPKIIDMRQNINFLSPEFNIDFSQINTQNIPNYTKLRNTISQNYSILKEQFKLISGDFGAMYQLFKQLDTRTCTIYGPADSRYKEILIKLNYEIKMINRFENIESNIINNSLIIFANPSFPDGAFYNLDDFMRSWKSSDNIIFIDESYLDFTNEKSATRFLADFANLYILRSINSFYGNFGVNYSLLISSILNIKNIEEVSAKNEISIFDTVFLSSLFKDKSFTKIAKAIMAKNSILLEKVLISSELFERIYPSRANFILAKLKNITATKFTKELKCHNIMINDLTKSDFLGDKFVQISIKNEEEIKEFTKAIDNIKSNL
jgi:threonine-phosphate decarboxylase